MRKKTKNCNLLNLKNQSTITYQKLSQTKLVIKEKQCVTNKLQIENKSRVCA